MATRLDPRYGYLEATTTWLRLDDEQLQSAAHMYTVWQASTAEFVRDAQLANPHDPFGDCLVCATTHRDALDDGELAGMLFCPPPQPIMFLLAVACSRQHKHAFPSLCRHAVPPFPMSIMMDASTKPCRFTAAGAAQPRASHPPRTSSHLSSVAHQVFDDFSDGTLSSDAQQRYAEHCAAEQTGAVCSSNLTCSRPSASAPGMVDVAGLCGICCSHCTPGRDAMVAMLTPEQHAYHVRTFTSVIRRRPDVVHVYIDIACRLKPALMEVVRERVEAGNLHPDVLKKVGCADWQLRA